MRKVFEASFDPIPGGTCAIVNPLTGKIYGFLRSENWEHLTRTPSTIITHVEVPPETFKEELDKGLYYKDGFFYRSWNPKQNPSQMTVFAGQVVEFVAPEPFDETVEARIHSEDKIVYHEALIMREGKVTLTVPELQPGLYTLRCESGAFGRLTVDMAVVPRGVPADARENFEGEARQMAEIYTLYQTLLNAQDIEGVTNAVTESVLEQVRSVQDQAERIAKSSGQSVPTPKLTPKEKSTIRELIKKFLKKSS